MAIIRFPPVQSTTSLRETGVRLCSQVQLAIFFLNSVDIQAAEIELSNSWLLSDSPVEEFWGRSHHEALSCIKGQSFLAICTAFLTKAIKSYRKGIPFMCTISLPRILNSWMIPLWMLEQRNNCSIRSRNIEQLSTLRETTYTHEHTFIALSALKWLFEISVQCWKSSAPLQNVMTVCSTSKLLI